MSNNSLPPSESPSLRCMEIMEFYGYTTMLGTLIMGGQGGLTSLFLDNHGCCPGGLEAPLRHRTSDVAWSAPAARSLESQRRSWHLEDPVYWQRSAVSHLAASEKVLKTDHFMGVRRQYFWGDRFRSFWGCFGMEKCKKGCFSLVGLRLGH